MTFSDLERQMLKFCSNVQHLNLPLTFGVSAGTKLSRAKHKDKKWITLGLRKSSRHKNKLYKNWIQTKSKEDEIKYNKKLS